MKITSLFGGPRKKGNTATVLNWVEEELRHQGHTIERIHLASKTLSGCIGCSKCKEIPENPGCIQNDDAIDIINRMVGSDMVILASPLYYWGFTAQMKALMDRCHCLYRGVCGAASHTSFVENQRQAMIITAADPFENNAEQMLTAFQRFLVYNKARSAGELFVCNCTSPDELGSDIKQSAVAFAGQLFVDTQRPYPLLMPAGAPNMIPGVK